MKKFFFLLIVFTTLTCCPFSFVNAQGGVSINSAGAAPDNSAGLDVSFTNKGELMPRMTTAQRNAIANPAKGLFIYNTDCDVINYNAGTSANPSWATVNATNVLAAGVTIAAIPVGAICSGSSVTFTATPANGINSPTYQWQVNGVNAGTNSTTYSTSSLNNGDVVTCILSSNENCVTGSPATSNPVTMLVNTVPVITGTDPTGFCSGSAVTLSASANLGTINWYANSTGGSSLSTGASFTTSGLNSSTTYYVDATASGCTTASRTAVTATYYPNVPSQPGAITGPSAEDLDSVATYSISALPNVAYYFWTVALGTITSGQGTTSITVAWGDSSGAASVSVMATSPCGNSATQTLPVYFNSETFNLTGSTQMISFPSGISTINITAYGAQGANSGGLGGSATGQLTVTAGEVLYVNVGGAGNYPTGGYNGGGTGGYVGGGGASDVRAGGTALGNRVIVAGGGGATTAWGSTGGAGGGTSGGSAGSSTTYGPCNCYAAGGTGGTQSTGGSAGYPVNYSGTTGQSGSLGTGGGTDNDNDGGGGAGYYGGGSGGTPGYSGWGSGGGGGSGYIGGVTGGSMQTGVQTGNGQVVITW